MKSSTLGQLFKTDSYFCNNSGSDGCFSKAFYSEGNDLAVQIYDVVRKEAESCDNLQGFQMIHSLCGGTGSGLSTNFQSIISNDFQDKITANYCLIPSPSVSGNVLELYNFILSHHYISESSILTVYFDNEALTDICFRSMNITKPTYSDLNSLISKSISGITSSMRFPGMLNSDMRKLATNLTPFYRMHYFVSSVAPLTPEGVKQTIPSITTDLFNTKNILVSCNCKKGIYLSASAIFRGRFSSREVEEQMNNIPSINSSYFCSWIPSNIQTVECNVPHPGCNISGTFIGNSTAVKEIFNRIDQNYSKMFDKGAYVQHYMKNDEFDLYVFDDCRYDIKDLSSQCELYETADVDEDDSDVDEDVYDVDEDNSEEEDIVEE